MLRFCPLLGALLLLVGLMQAQEIPQSFSESPARGREKDYVKQRDQWFTRGRLMPGRSSAELRRRAYQSKLQMRTQRAAARLAAAPNGASLSTGSWIPLGPLPLASDASGNGTQDYRQVAGRVTAVAIDPADLTGNTVYIGAAQGGVWKSTNAAYSVAENVVWSPLTDNQATLSIGSIAIQPGNADPSRSVILAATGEANNSGDSYFGLGILRSTDAGNSWTLASSANNGALSLAGLGGTRMAFATRNNLTVVSAMGTSAEGIRDGAVTSGTKPGLYTSLNAGQTWAYNALVDPAGATDATSATSVAYNAFADSGNGMFFAAVRYHGFYSSPDGVHWTRLTAQPGGVVLSTASCPPQSTSNGRACPIYRGEITSIPERNEMYAWYVSVDAYGITQDEGIWQSLNGGASWTAISDAGITNCGDISGCGVEQGVYNLELLAVPNGSATDLYAGAVNIYKCAINSSNPNCTASPFVNLTHAYGCVPAGAPAHVHPSQHALAAMIPSIGSDSGNELLYFANEGGVYRALNGFSGFNDGACSAVHQFDDLNQNLGSLAQFVTFSQHPTDANTLFGGTQGNGSPATNHATSSSAWINVLGGDGAYTAIDPLSTSNWYASNPDIPPGGLGIQLCAQGINCNTSRFGFVATSSDVGGDDGGFYFPYILDSGSTSAMLVGTCRVWRGPRTGGAFNALSPNFETLGWGTCTGNEVNQVRALATAGPTQSSSGSSVVYATTSGLGPIEGPLDTPGGRVWATTDSSAGISSFSDVTDNGPQGNINPYQFPISSVAADPSDPTGKTAYVTVMGFTGGSGHVWKTTSAGATWTDFTANLPDSPANAVAVYPALSQVYVATDVGVFASSTSTPNWVELGPDSGTSQPGSLPNVAVTALGIFASGGQQLLRASTYGRGIWEFNLVITPDFQLAVANTPLRVFAGQTGTFNATMTALNGYTNSVTLSCVAGSTAPPNVCAPSPVTMTPVSKTPFTISTSGPAGDYNFNIQSVGSDTNHLTRKLPMTLHVVDFGITAPSPSSVTVPRGTTSGAVSFQVTAAGSFNQAVTVSCSSAIPNATCNLSPGTTVTGTSIAPVNMSASVAVPASTAAGAYSVTLQANTAGAPSPQTVSFTLNVTANPHFEFTIPASINIKAGMTGTRASISVGAQDGFSGTVGLTCTSSYNSGACNINPSSVSSYPAEAELTLSGTTFAAGSYTVSVTGTAASRVKTQELILNVGDYSLSAAPSLRAVPGSRASSTVTVASAYAYSGEINLACDASALTGGDVHDYPDRSHHRVEWRKLDLTVAINVPNDATPGTYNITLSSHDTEGSPSHSTTIALTIAADFVLTSATASQTVTAGQTTGAYNLTVQPMGSSFDAPVSLACTAGLPSGASCNFSPATPVTPGTSAVNVVMSISTPASTAAVSAHRWVLYATWLYLPLAVSLVAIRPGRVSRTHSLCVMPFAIALISVFASCSGVSTTDPGGTGHPHNPVSYHVTVSASSPGVPDAPGHSAVVALVIN